MNHNQFISELYLHASALRGNAVKFTQNIDDAEDLLQDTMLKAMRYYKHFDRGINLRGWLFVIMKNTFLNTYKRDMRDFSLITRQEQLSSPDLMMSATRNTAESSFAMADITKALDSLSGIYRIPFIKYIEGYKYEEIAEELSIPLGTVKTRIHQGREILKKRLGVYKNCIN